MNHQELRIQAVTFDLWETLLFEKDGDSNRRSGTRCNNIAMTFAKLGVPVSAAQIEIAVKQLVDELLTIWENNVDISHVEQLELLVKHVSNGSLTLKPEWIQQLSAAYISPMHEVPPSLNPDAQEVLQNLADSSRRIGLICNTGFTPGFGLEEFLDHEGVLDFFDFLTFSDEIGFRKPDPRIFRVAAANLNVVASSIVHVGDNEIADVQGAKRAGYRAIWLNSDAGRDKIADADPMSLVARSRNLGKIGQTVNPDDTVTSLVSVMDAVEKLEKA